ncbi:hypothetical protein [Actinomadura sp. HBU206391]|uniref:hypothetical protein n=1 Tax=Actinomadura sp. HBU206391 TaxID=2731692 RepID=UPI00164FE540|nr:hypothetical protein [Actinomadura sp. HBU206391]MBC6458904.1 hypothetical protein [Actinomadura sp. HBU206391]
MRGRRLALLALIPMLVLGSAACGADGPSSASTPTSKKTDEASAMRAFAKCMRENGVNMSDPVQDGGGIRIEVKEGQGDGPEKHKAAEAKCRHLQPNGGEPPKMSAEQVAKMREHAKCMRQHGIDMPDPDENGRVTIKRTNKPGSSGGSNSVSVGGDPRSQKFKDADKACRHLRPKLGPPEKGNGS